MRELVKVALDVIGLVTLAAAAAFGADVAGTAAACSAGGVTLLAAAAVFERLG